MGKLNSFLRIRCLNLISGIFERMKSIQKYFLALLPPEPLLSKSTQIKEQLRDRHQVKYALKSPPHITVKMPFSYNEAKEDLLAEKLGEFLKDQAPLAISIAGIGTFGSRVIFQQIISDELLWDFQSRLGVFCKRELLLTNELSDRNFHPHMTLAFKDLKPSKFSAVLETCKALQFSGNFLADKLFLLKRLEGKWKICRELQFGRSF